MTATDSEPTAGEAAEPGRAAGTVLVGCSFAGLEFLYRVARRAGRFTPGAMTVIDARATHPYIPLAHEAVSGSRTPDALVFDTPEFCRAIGAEWITGTVTGIDHPARTVMLAGGRAVPFGRLVVAVGSVPDIPEPFAAAPLVIAAKFVDEAAALRRRLHVLRVSGAAMLRAVVIGAGATGVEWGAELAGGRVDGARIATTIIDGAPRVLPTFPRSVSRRIANVLSAMGVELVMGRRAVGVSRDHVLLDGGASLPCDVVVWAGGVRPHPIAASLGLPVTPRGYIVVTPRLDVPGMDGIFAIGDCARVVVDGREWSTTPRAIEAIWQGAALARRWTARSGDAPARPHHAHGEFWWGISLGPRRAAVVYRGWMVQGGGFVLLRRGLQRSYYRRFRKLAQKLAR